MTTLESPPRETPPVRRPPARPRPMAAGHVVLVGAVALGLASLLNAETLREMAERQPFDSPMRGAALAVTRPLERISQLLSLDRPGEAFDALRNRDVGGSGEFATVPVDLPVTGGDPVPAEPEAEQAAQDEATPATTAPGAPATTVDSSPVLDDGTQVVYVGGDSQAQALGPALERLVATDTVEAETDYKVSSGLTRPDFFDWPAHLQREVAARRPDVVVVMFGGNDAQPIEVDGEAVPMEDPRWKVEYARRVGATMDFLSASGRTLVWVGVPNADDDGFTKRLSVLREVMAAEAAERPAVRFVDAWELFSGPNGGYAAYIVDDDGQAKLMRANDGFHFNETGAAKLARAVNVEVQAALAAGVSTPAG
jgi:uncharacterized protein